MTDAASVNYARRDDAIRRQTYSVVRKLQGLPTDLFAAYWRDVHGPLCARMPGLGYYAQHHFSRVYYANLWPPAEGVRQMDLVLDGAVEIGFADAAGAARFAAAAPILFGDEFNLFEHAVAYNLAEGSRTLVDREVDAIPNGPDRLHRLHLYLNGDSDPGFRAWLAGFAVHLSEAAEVRKLRLHLPAPYDNAHPAPPSPKVDHRVSEERRDIAIIEIGFESALAARQMLEGAAYQATLADQAKYVRSQAAFLVTGIHTFIRDGVITTAGLRGSRAAELIEKIGAANQVQADVASRFIAPFPAARKPKSNGTHS